MGRSRVRPQTVYRYFDGYKTDQPSSSVARPGARWGIGLAPAGGGVGACVCGRSVGWMGVSGRWTLAYPASTRWHAVVISRNTHRERRDEKPDAKDFAQYPRGDDPDEELHVAGGALASNAAAEHTTVMIEVFAATLTRSTMVCPRGSPDQTSHAVSTTIFVLDVGHSV